MKIQIYSLNTPEDALQCVDEGVGFIGVVAGSRGRIETELSFAAARRIFAALPDDVMKVALSISPDLTEVLETVEALSPTVIHLSGAIEEMPVERVAELRQTKPLVKIMRAIPVGGPETRERAIRLALAYAPVADFLILDTPRADAAGAGATGATHDWGISAEIVRRANVPVILAGGLGPDNVAEAVKAVRPWGVDSYSRTNLPGSKLKDHEKVKAFVQAARISSPV